VVDKYSENEEKVEYVIFQRGLQVGAGVFMVPSIRNQANRLFLTGNLIIWGLVNRNVPRKVDSGEDN
jgi:hypothetical protein